MGTQAIIYILMFVGVVLIVEGIYLVAFGKSIKLNSRVNRRLALLEQGKDREEVFETLRKERDQHRQSFKFPVMTILSSKAQQANIAFSPKALLAVMGLVAVFAFGGLTYFASLGLPTRILVALVMGGGGVYFWLNGKAKKRMALFEEQLPDAIDLIVRSLRVGHPFANAINIVAQEMPDPIGTEFGMIVDETAYGAEVASALHNMAERIDVPDLRFLTVAVAIQSKSGGNLAEVLDGLSKVVRARFKLFRRVKAITAEAKWSGMFLSGFPIAALLGVNVLNPHYYDAVKPTEYYMPAAVAVFSLLAINAIVMRAMVNIKV
ncbi:MAG: type II secretion system F family protein [Rhodobacteraceae bacterium]|nr:type II secretion system F family protein [Paracoccaceae bacterium]